MDTKETDLKPEEVEEWITSVIELEYGYLVNDEMHVPDDPRNRHYQDIQRWIAEGNRPGRPPGPSEEDLKAQVEQARQAVYLQEALPLIFESYTGVNNQDEIKSKIEQIKERFPKQSNDGRQGG